MLLNFEARFIFVARTLGFVRIKPPCLIRDRRAAEMIRRLRYFPPQPDVLQYRGDATDHSAHHRSRLSTLDSSRGSRLPFVKVTLGISAWPDCATTALRTLL